MASTIGHPLIPQPPMGSYSLLSVQRGREQKVTKKKRDTFNLDEKSNVPRFFSTLNLRIIQPS